MQQILILAHDQIQETVKMLKGTIPGTPAYQEALNNAAEAYRGYQIAKTRLEDEFSTLEATLKSVDPFKVFFPATLDKVVLSEGAVLTEIDNKVIEELTYTELKAIVKVTEKSLEDLGRSELIPRYKKETGRKAGSLRYTAVNKDEKKLIESGKIPD